MYKEVTSAIHPKTGEIYTKGDIICIYQGRFGHNNIMTIRSLWKEEDGYVLVSDTEKCFGTGLYAVKHKLDKKELNRINRAKQLAAKYS